MSVNIHRHGFDTPDESTRLLHANDEEHGGGVESRECAPTPLPMAQLTTLIVVRIVDPIAYMQIFPYINQLLADLRIAPPDQVGFYSGFIESAYSFAQMFSVYQWGTLSDIIGRRPVVLLTLTGIALTTVSFGFSKSLVTILASRFLGGLVAGNIAVLHTILVEITDDTNQDVAIPIYSLARSTGAIIGPLVGGTFANAAIHFPKFFSWPIFIDHPYLPPCIISAMCTLLGLGMGYLFIEETLASKRKSTTGEVHGNVAASAPDTEMVSAETEHTTVKALLAIPSLRALTLSGLALSFLSSAFEVVFSLFCYTPVDAGGLELQPAAIGGFLAIASTFAVLLRLVAMPYLLRRFDYAMIYSACMYLWPLPFALLPILNAFALARRHAHSEIPAEIVPKIGTMTNGEVGIWIALALVLAVSRVAAVPFSIIMLLVKRHAPTMSTSNYGAVDGTSSDVNSGSKSVTKKETGTALGRCNGLVQFAICLGRAVGPVAVTTLFMTTNGSTWARQWGVGWAWSIVMVWLSVVGARLTKDI